MADERAVLGASVDRLRDLVEPLSPEQRRQQAYPSEWSVAQVLGHLGSGAVIAGHRVDQALGGPEIDAQPIWDEWNAKDPDAMVVDGLAADAAFLDRLDALTTDRVVVSPSEAHGPADVVLPAEALVRLVYGRLDPDHTPSFEGDEADLEELRRAFPGV